MMAISRRKFLAQSAALVGMSLLPTRYAASSSPKGAFFCAFSDDDDQHFLGVLNEKGELLHQFAAPSRGHSASVSSDGRRAVFFARRPGRWMMMVDVHTGRILSEINAKADRHFYGHGVFSQDDSMLFVTENDFENNRGIIGVYETGTLTRIREFPSFGIEPHELAILSDGQTLVVANGGIETHPDFGRRKLNLPTMAPSLVYIRIDTGMEQERCTPPHHQLSLRHLAVTADDRVIVGAQYQGPPDDDHPLVFMHRRGETLVSMSGQPLEHQRGLAQYIASVAQCGNGKYALTSSPRGDKVSLWDVDQRSWIKDFRLPDIGGIATSSDKRRLVLTSGNGKVYAMIIGEWVPWVIHVEENLHWDNHVSSLT